MAYRSEDHAARNLLNSMRKAGVTLPKHPDRAKSAAQRITEGITSGDTMRTAAARYQKGALKSINSVADARRQLRKNASGDVQMSLEKTREPLGSLQDKGIPFNVYDEKELMKIREWARIFYSTHYLQSLCVDIFAQFPIQGMEVQCKDPEIKAFYEQLFFDELEYDTFLIDFGREFWIAGEVNSLANFNEVLGVWDHEEILNPDDIFIEKSPFSKEHRYKLRVPQSIRDIIDNVGGKGNPRDMHIIEQYYPEFLQMSRNFDEEQGLDVSNVLLSRTINKSSPWDVRGTPHMLRAFRQLIMEEALNAAQDAICLLAGSPILTDKGVSCIENIKMGDNVLTHLGRYRKVLRTMVRQADEPGVTLRWYYDRPLTLTGKHPVLVRRNGVQDWIPASQVMKHDQVWHPGQPQSNKEFISVWDHLNQDDWVVYNSSDDAYGMTGHSWYEKASYQTCKKARERVESVLLSSHPQDGDIIRHSRFGAKTQHFKTEYKLTEDLLWLIGLHVADGSAGINNSSGVPVGSVRICLGIDEVSLQQRAIQVIRETFDIEPTIRPIKGKKAVFISANSLPLAMWLREMCGVKETKRFPSWAFGLSQSQTLALLSGWFDGDGHRAHDHIRGVTYYRSLQEQVARLIRHAGFVSTVHALESRCSGGTVGVIGCQTDVFSDAVNISGPSSSLRQADCVSRVDVPSDDFSDGYWVEVRKVDHHQVTATVYNLEVEEDNSYCAPIAVHNCDRLYSPLILAKLGSPDLGDGEPWIPDIEELDNFRDDMQMALAADFRFLAYHFGLDIQNVFGRESMPRFDADYDRLERKMLQIWGIGEELISGSNSGTYASSALNREFVTQKMSSYQKYIQKHFKKRCEVVAEAQGHFDYEVSGSLHIPVYEEIYEVDEDGTGYIRKRPKLLIPELNFSSINLRDESTERTFLGMLKNMGVPISDQALMVNIPFDFKDEIERVQEERVQKVLAEAESNVRMINALESKGLPLNSELQGIKQQMVIAQQDAESGQITPAENVPPAMPDENIMTEPLAAPNISPDESNQAPVQGESPQSYSDALPRNQISYRPEISDEMKDTAPRAASINEEGPIKVSRLTTGPSTYGKRVELTKETVEDIVENRPWASYLPRGAKERLAAAQERLNGAKP